jgi:two-component sensor histidine kinase
VAALVSQTIPDKQLGQTLIERVRLAADTGDLLKSSKTNALVLGELLAVIVQRSYGDQVILNGPETALSGRQTHSLRLVFHEMTTNALKYGALSAADGKIKIDWHTDGAMLTINWCEYDGPKVGAPSKHNFGSKLIINMLKQIGARLEPTFAETGYCYRISVPLGGNEQLAAVEKTFATSVTV